MAVVHLASSLARYAGGERVVVLDGSTVEQILSGLGDRYPGFRETAIDGDGRPRPHVRLFVNNAQVGAGSDLGRSVGDADEIAIISAIAGG